ncbi:BlaR1 family beta-lactam sensor/signal transducer [Metabacillus sp. Hm71]|uniref:BlaR1 family beta-lactam sensor/signal transducer n=1 Tax=Metabacillus sp. Hm71 TaxID=3450743 RepID=UPI003F41C35F
MGNSFFSLFFICNILLCVMFGVILFIKKIGKNHITVKTQYVISIIALLTLLIPFVPYQTLNTSTFFDWIMNIDEQQTSLSEMNSTDKSTEPMTQNGNMLQDFSMSVNQSPFKLMDTVFFIVWILGIVGMLLATLISNRKISTIKKSLQNVPNEEVISLFELCKKDIHLRKKIVLGASPLIQSPITFGLFRPYIVLPKDWSSLSTNELKCVLLHELYHCKHRDMLVNYLICLFRAVYWFNPFVWYVLRELKTEMEMNCDYAVLITLDQESQFKYGEVILKFASLPQRTSSLIAASEIGSSYKQTKKRIVNIVNFQAASLQLKIKSAFVFILVFAVIIMSIPSLSVLAVNKNTHALSKTNVVYKDYSSLFDEFSGSFVLYDSKKNMYTIHNKEESTTRLTPNSTYKIYSGLFALESGIITKDHSAMNWDGTPHEYDEWNQDQDLFSAMKRSTTWYFQHLDQQLGKKKLEQYVDKIDYGNGDLSSDITTYWLDGTLKISPIEQVDLLKKFYDNEFGFEQANVQTIKDAIFIEESNNKRFSGKTGTSIVNGEDIDGWFIGYVESADNTYFFATHIQGEKQAGGSSAAEVALSILAEEGIYPSSSAAQN